MNPFLRLLSFAKPYVSSKTARVRRRESTVPKKKCNSTVLVKNICSFKYY